MEERDYWVSWKHPYGPLNTSPLPSCEAALDWANNNAERLALAWDRPFWAAMTIYSTERGASND
jgi:hypothetical protein